MPQSISIAAFVFGAVLLLIALLGGGFKIFGAEMPGKAGGVARAVAAFGGVIFLLVGIGGSMQEPAPAESPPTPMAKVSASVPAPQPKPRLDDVSSRLPAAIGGYWRDDAGTVYQVYQDGNMISFVGQNGQLVSQGRGHVSQRQVEVQYQTNLPSTGRGTLTVSADGRQIIGNFYEKSAAGQEQYRRVFAR